MTALPGNAPRVVVGVDDSESSAAALRWAVREAARRGWVVDVVTAWPDQAAVFVREVPGHHSDHRHRAVSSQRRVLSAVVGSESSLPHIRTFVENARPSDALVAHSRGASMLVVGASHGDGAGELTADIVATPGTVRSACPIVVIDEPRTP